MQEYIYQLGENNNRLYKLISDHRDLLIYLCGPFAEEAKCGSGAPSPSGVMHELWQQCLTERDLLSELEELFAMLRQRLTGDVNTSGTNNAKSR